MSGGARHRVPAACLGWSLASAAGLGIAHAVDPYVFGAATMLAAGLSALGAVAVALLDWRRLPLALAAGAPSALALWVLSGFHWA